LTDLTILVLDLAKQRFLKGDEDGKTGAISRAVTLYEDLCKRFGYVVDDGALKRLEDAILLDRISMLCQQG